MSSELKALIRRYELMIQNETHAPQELIKKIYDLVPVSNLSALNSVMSTIVLYHDFQNKMDVYIQKLLEDKPCETDTK